MLSKNTDNLHDKKMRGTSEQREIQLNSLLSSLLNKRLTSFY